MVNPADVTSFFNGVWVASPLQGEGESEGLFHGIGAWNLPLTSVLSACPRGEAERPGPLQRSRVDAQAGEPGGERADMSRYEQTNCKANTRLPVGSAGNPGGHA
jgi:hypothetical protein